MSFPGNISRTTTITFNTNLSNTPVQTTTYPAGAFRFTASYRLLAPTANATAGQYAKVVVNAASDADAAGKLATAGQYYGIAQGDDWVYTADLANPVTRIDFTAAVAVGTESTYFQIIAES